MKKTSNHTRKDFPVYSGTRRDRAKHKQRFKQVAKAGGKGTGAFTLVVFCALLAITALYLKAPFQAYYLIHTESFQIAISLLSVGSLTGALFGKVTENDWKGGLGLGIAVSGIVCAFAITLL